MITLVAVVFTAIMSAGIWFAKCIWNALVRQHGVK